MGVNNVHIVHFSISRCTRYEACKSKCNYCNQADLINGIHWKYYYFDKDFFLLKEIFHFLIEYIVNVLAQMIEKNLLISPNGLEKRCIRSPSVHSL